MERTSFDFFQAQWSNLVNEGVFSCESGCCEEGGTVKKVPWIRLVTHEVNASSFHRLRAKVG